MPLIVTIDFETRSEADLVDIGAYNYANHPTTEVLCLAYKIGDKPTQIWIPQYNPIKDQMPLELIVAIQHCKALIEAHNVFFERCIWTAIMVEQFGWIELPFSMLRCSAAKCAALALPRSLEQAALVTKCKEQKDMKGHKVMQKLCKPRRPSKNNPNKFFSDPKFFEKLYKYCKQDVNTEHRLSTLLPPLNPTEQRVWQYDQLINLRGIQIDIETVKNAIRLLDILSVKAEKEIQKISKEKIQSINQVVEIRKYVEKKLGYKIEGVGKEVIEELLEKKLPKKVRKILELRKTFGRSSVAKYQALLDRTSTDNRLRETLLYHGATTGRWTGLGVQPQNLPKGKIKYKDQKEIIKLVNNLDLKTLENLHNPMEALSSIIRAMFISESGKRLIAADYSAIEARIGAWYAGETKILDVFAAGESPYIQLAEILYKRPIDKYKDPIEYAAGKAGILSAQYGIGPAKFSKKNNIELSESEKIVYTYRNTYTKIKRNWSKLERAAMKCVSTKQTVDCGKVRYGREKGFLFCVLPSGRKLAYYQPKIIEGKYGLCLSYMGIDTFTKKWTRLETWGGTLFNHIVQGTSRDIMAHAIPKLEFANYPVVLTVHDEIVCETDKKKTIEGLIEIMCDLPAWGKDIPIKAEGWKGKRYRK